MSINIGRPAASGWKGSVARAWRRRTVDSRGPRPPATTEFDEEAVLISRVCRELDAAIEEQAE